jgi:hypothetical protein
MKAYDSAWSSCEDAKKGKILSLRLRSFRA